MSFYQNGNFEPFIVTMLHGASSWCPPDNDATLKHILYQGIPNPGLIVTKKPFQKRESCNYRIPWQEKKEAVSKVKIHRKDAKTRKKDN